MCGDVNSCLMMLHQLGFLSHNHCPHKHLSTVCLIPPNENKSLSFLIISYLLNDGSQPLNNAHTNLGLYSYQDLNYCNNTERSVEMEHRLCHQ